MRYYKYRYTIPLKKPLKNTNHKTTPPHTKQPRRSDPWTCPQLHQLSRLSLKMRRIQNQGSQHAANRPRNRDRHDPGEDQETHSLPVDSLEGAVAEADADGGACYAH